VYSEKLLMMDRGTHVEVYSKNKFEKLVHLVSFIIRIELSGECMVIEATYIECSASQPCSMQ